MSDLRIFKIDDTGIEELPTRLAAVEKDLQTLLERNMEACLGVKFLASEYHTGRSLGGFIDSLGLDENFCPVIVEYKKRNNENIITQALFYLDWLLDHQAEFVSLVREKLGSEIAMSVDFLGARILCVASDFTRFDEKAIYQIGRDIELIRYRFYGADLFCLERLKSPVSSFVPAISQSADDPRIGDVGMPPAMRSRIKNMSSETELIYLELISFAETLGEDVTIRFLKHYIAFARKKHFTCAQPLKNTIKLWINLDPAEYAPEEGFSRDVSNLGHHATGDLEIDIHSREDLERAKPVIEAAYQKN
ncbi:MAG: DUF91 domain-containing protein [Desulfovibrio sp.]|nr:DUF91 domain-containing protein [Desulfovibrio sp.]